MSQAPLLSTAEVAHRLGVKPATVYAYVSRGLLLRDPASTHRRSLFSVDAVDALATGARHPNRSAALEVAIQTSITYLDRSGRLCYRGHDVGELARYRSFEEVAALLWEGPAPAPWELDADTRTRLRALRSTLGPQTSPVELIPLAVAALAANDPERSDRRPAAVRRAGMRMLAGVLTLLGREEEPAQRSVAARLWSAFSPAPPRPAQLAAMDAILVSLADHELAASTFAARVAASAWADPYRVVLSGLGALGGSLHGGASLGVAGLLAQIHSPGQAFSVLEQAQMAGGVPGFGHRVYRERDPRSGQLLERLESVSVDRDRLARLTALLSAAEALGLSFPNVDFALAALLEAMALPAEAGPTLFACARIAGLLAHALEEYPHRLRFRPRATYVGPVPRP